MKVLRKGSFTFLLTWRAGGVGGGLTPWFVNRESSSSKHDEVRLGQRENIGRSKFALFKGRSLVVDVESNEVSILVEYFCRLPSFKSTILT